MFFAIFFGIIFAVLFLASLPFTLPLFGIGAAKIVESATRKVVEIGDRRAENAKIQAELDRGHNPFLWSWPKALLASFIFLVVGVGIILLCVLFGFID